MSNLLNPPTKEVPVTEFTPRQEEEISAAERRRADYVKQVSAEGRRIIEDPPELTDYIAKLLSSKESLLELQTHASMLGQIQIRDSESLER